MPKISLPVRGRQDRLSALVKTVQGCRACPRMDGRKRVLTARNGRAGVRVMFIAEAPGRNGADRTGVPIHGDPSGNLFEQMLASVGWTRDEVFVTNCVLCNPRDANGNNDAPTPEEILNCSVHLESQIRYVDPAVIATLGAKPLTALGLIYPHEFSLKNTAGKAVLWGGRKLFPLYHPSSRAFIHRSKAQQIKDFAALKSL